MSIEQHLAAIRDELLEEALVHPLDHQKDINLVVTVRRHTVAFAAEVKTEHEHTTFSNIHVSPTAEGCYRAALAAVNAIDEPSLLPKALPPKAKPAGASRRRKKAPKP